jgi:SAM-dependent methyltransferase
MIVDKKNLLANWRSPVLELGCGNRRCIAGAVTIDQRDTGHVDIVGDVFDVLPLIPPQSVQAIYSFHFFEHVRDVNLLMNALERILAPGGHLEIVVPHFSNPYFYSDATHHTFFGLYSFSYWAEDRLFRRQVPHYQEVIAFELQDVYLIFKSPPPFYFRYAAKRFLQSLFNLSRGMQEFYEENLCYLFPCYEIRFRLVKKR